MIRGESCDAVITHVTSLSSHDGPGLRTTLFFKGCSLKCRWCHNPETIRSVPELEWDQRLCIGCRMCHSRCNSGAIIEGRGYLPDKSRCIHCFACVDNCPAQALRAIGKTYSLDALEARIIKDEALIKAMQGGVTFSGGEPVLQATFIMKLAGRLKKRGFHLALDTSGQAPWESYKQILPYMDLLLFDLKEMNPLKHSIFTGVDNRLIHTNILSICDYIQHERLPVRIWIRTPLIPDMTASVENITAIGFFIDQHLSGSVEKWELCAFNNLCCDKYKRLGIRWELSDTALLSESEMEHLLLKAKLSAPTIKCVTASGLNKK